MQSIKKLEDNLRDWCLEPTGWKLVKSDTVQKDKRYRDADEDELEFDLTDADTARYYGDRTFIASVGLSMKRQSSLKD